MCKVHNVGLRYIKTVRSLLLVYNWNPGNSCSKVLLVVNSNMQLNKTWKCYPCQYRTICKCVGIRIRIRIEQSLEWIGLNNVDPSVRILFWYLYLIHFLIFMPYWIFLTYVYLAGDSSWGRTEGLQSPQGGLRYYQRVPSCSSAQVQDAKSFRRQSLCVHLMQRPYRPSPTGCCPPPIL